ncbi:MAG TPA: hypothetical protein VGX78_21945 [Pirellulales bacterium]|nr:hypothetical protein [Pirellulales bacterium]
MTPSMSPVADGPANSRNQVDPLTLHGGAPVSAGNKWIAPKWLRQTRRG